MEMSPISIILLSNEIFLRSKCGPGLRMKAMSQSSSSTHSSTLTANVRHRCTLYVRIQEQLKRVFNIPLSPPEFGALMSYFDKEGVGYINCAEFLIQFFRTGFEERSRVRSAWIEYRVKKERADREEEQRRLQENLKRAQAQVNFDFTEEEFDSATSKLVETIRGFDRRQLGPAGMRAFDMDALTPTEFKETLKKTFNLKLTPAELGALVTLFDPKACGLVSCPSFLNAFAHMKVKLEQAFSVRRIGRLTVFLLPLHSNHCLICLIGFG